MYVHFIACIWYYIIDKKKEWIPPLDYLKGWPDGQPEFYDKSTQYRYCVSLYASCLFLFGNDLGARDDTQLIFISIVNIMGAIA